MSEELRKVRVKLEAETARYQRDLESSRRETSKWRKKAESDVGSVAKTFRNLAVAAGIGLLTKRIVDATATQEAAVKQLEAGWKSTGGAVGLTVAEMTQHAADLQKISLFGDEQIIEAQAKLVTFTNIADQQFKKATMAALNLSSRMGTDLNSSVLQIGKALNAPITGVSALAEAGIQFTDAQKDVIKSLVETGEKAKAQEIILAELETQFGGSAAAARDTFGGAIKSLGNAFADLWEAGEGLDDAKTSVEELTTLLQDPDTVAAANTLASAVIKGFQKAAEAIMGAVNMARWAGEEIAALVHGPAIDDIDRIQKQIDNQQQKIDQWRAKVEANGGVGAAFELKQAQEEMDRLNARMATGLELKRSLSGGTPAPQAGPAKTPSGGDVGPTAINTELQKLVDQQRDLYAKIHEDKLRANEQDIELENLRYQRQQEQLALSLEKLREKNALTEDLKRQHHAAVESAEQLHLDNLREIGQRKADQLSEEQQKQRDFYAKIHEERLRVTEQDVELENLRYQQQVADLALSLETLREKNALTEELGLQHHAAIEEAEALHLENLRLIEQKKTDIIKDEEEKREALRKQAASSLLSFTAQQLSITSDMLAQSGKENSALFKMLFLAQQAAAIPSMIVGTEKAAVDALEVGGPFYGPVLAGATRALGYASIGIVAGQTVAGIAHGGLTNVPDESTYLLEKGERVLSPRQNEDFTRFLEDGNELAASSVQVMINGVESAPDREEQDGHIRRVVINEVSSKSSKTMRALQANTNLQPKGRF